MSNNSRGFTLIELMIVVAIVAILAAIAYPSYQAQIRKSNRAVAKTALMTYAQFLEKCYTQNSTYVGCTYAPTNSVTFDSGKNLYAINTDAAASMTANAYVITASAQNSQAGDANCALFTLSNANVRTATNGGGTNCWQ